MSQDTDNVNKLKYGQQQLTPNLPVMVASPETTRASLATRVWQALRRRRWRDYGGSAEQAVAGRNGVHIR